MTLNRWWLAAALVLSTGLAVLLLVSELPSWRLTLGLGALAVFLVAWALLARRAFEGNPPAVALTVIVVIVAGVGTAAQPNFAIFQCIAFPMVWVLARTLRQAIVGNIAVALAVGVGFLLSRPFPGDLVEIGFTVALSLVFSIALGLWITQIATLSEERQALLDELRSTQEQLATVNRDAGVIAERARLARELHDTIAQDLTGLVMLTQRARRETDAAARDSQLAQIEESAREALTETRALVAGGAPTSLDGGLVSALERLSARFTRDTGITVRLNADVSSLDRGAEVVVLRCTQEALANVRKHSGAQTATVTLTSSTLIVSDDGHGFDPRAPSSGFGLTGMRDRVALVGGRVELESGASGTTLTISLAEVDA